MIKTPQHPCSLSTPATPPTLTPAPIQTTTLISTIPNEMEPLTHDKQEILRKYHVAQAGPATVTTRSPLSMQIPLSCPSARGSCTPSSVASPLAPATSLPMERLAQHCAIKRQCSTLESGTEDSGAEGTYGGAESTYGGEELESPVDPVLQNLTRMHEAFAESSCIRVEDISHLFAKRDAFTLQLLGVIGTMARQIKVLQDRGDTQATSLVRSGAKKIKVE